MRSTLTKAARDNRLNHQLYYIQPCEFSSLKWPDHFFFLYWVRFFPAQYKKEKSSSHGHARLSFCKPDPFLQGAYQLENISA